MGKGRLEAFSDGVLADRRISRVLAEREEGG